ncbi:hypothetical protein [Ureaplasma sp. ES3154-GEN]|uniref:hypothetical protein n=1 Tax=Ureaplasma sp. ES3154-GEN TaxID=2984844 RepID=UPI003FCCC50D
MFIGSFKVIMDQKNRVRIPAKINKLLDHSIDKVIVSLGLDGNLDLWLSYDEFLSFLSSSQHQNFHHKRFRELKRIICAHTWILKVDAANRITIPAVLTQKANLSREVYFWVWVRKLKCEIWMSFIIKIRILKLI